MTRTAAALALGSGIMFSACAGPQPKSEPIQIVKKSETINDIKKSKAPSSTKMAKTVSNVIVNKAQNAFIRKFVKDFDEGTFKEGFASMRQSSTSIVTVDYMLVGKDSDYAEDMVDRKGKEIAFDFPSNSEVGKILVMFTKPVTLGNALDIANNVYETHLSGVSGMKDPAFKPKRGRKGKLTGNVETIVFWIIRKRK
jgi:hypothetical protein